MTVERVISGGQTGVDRAALDCALEMGIACGGWCPLGRKAEDGPIDKKYPLTATLSAKYAKRTKWNVRDSDGTLILTCGSPTGGTALTQILAERMHKPLLVVDLLQKPSVANITDWLQDARIRVLNVAGPRAESQPDVYDRVRAFLHQVLQTASFHGDVEMEDSR